MSTIQLGANATLLMASTDVGKGKGTDLAGTGIGLDAINRAVAKTTRVVPSRTGVMATTTVQDSSITFSLTCDATAETDALFAGGGGQRRWMTWKKTKADTGVYGPVIIYPVCTIDMATDAVTYSVTCTQDGPAK